MTEEVVVLFADRVDAGRRLAAKLEHLRDEPVVVLGLPRGGVPVALQVALSLRSPLDVIVVRKLGVPFQPELGMGAVGEGGARVLNPEVLRVAAVSDRELAAVEARERVEVERRARRFRGGRPRRALDGKTAVVVDDGIATGSTARAACQIARQQGAARVVLAVPVAPPEWEERIGKDADELVSVATPPWFFAIGQFYEDFTQTTDDEVIACLEAAAASVPEPLLDEAPRSGAEEPLTHALGRSASDEDVELSVGSVRLAGRLTIPAHPVGVVVFAHGSGSSRNSPRNRFVAGVLNEAGLATLLFDLLTDDEARNRANVFNIELLAERLVGATGSLRLDARVVDLPVGYFGASTGAAAALWAAADLGSDVFAVASRGGRPDLAGARLASVTCPVLLIVGGDDDVVLSLNRAAKEELPHESQLVVVPGAGHLFEEPGTLEAAALAARDWFAAHL